MTIADHPRTPLWGIAITYCLLLMAGGCQLEQGPPSDSEVGHQQAGLHEQGPCSDVTASVSEHENAGRAYSVQQPCADAGGGGQQLFFDAFDDLNSWTESGEGDWNIESLHSSSGYNASGPPAAHVDNCDATCTIELANGIDLSGQSSAQLSFWRFIDSAFDSSDYLHVQLYDGSSWNTVFAWSGGNGDTNTWQQETVDLSDYLQSDFRLRFVAHANYTSEHAQIDDLVISAGGGTPTCSTWYASGTDEALGGDPAQVVTLHEHGLGTWSVGACASGPQCGDNVIDPGELCDGNCPTSCDDNDACTEDTLSGSASTCDAQCSYATVTSCAGGDGCCPSGCNIGNDSDCAGGCGDGVVSGGELCDGNCPHSCDDGDACTVDILAGSPLSCDARCLNAPLSLCQDNDGCCPSNCSAGNDNDCGGGGPTCPEFTETVSSHYAANRAYRQFSWSTWSYTYYANGSNDNLGTNSGVTVTLYENAPGNFSLTPSGACGCNCTGKSCGQDDGCGVECSGTCPLFQECSEVNGAGDYECVVPPPVVGDPIDPVTATAVTIQYLTLAIQQLVELQLELAQVPNSDDAMLELQQHEAELQQELDTVTAQGTLQ